MVLLHTARAIFGLSSLIAVWILATDLLETSNIATLDFLLLQVGLLLLGLLITTAAIYYELPGTDKFSADLKRAAGVGTGSVIVAIITVITPAWYLVIFLLIGNLTLLVSLPQGNQLQRQIKLYAIAILLYPVLAVIIVILFGEDIDLASEGISVLAVISLAVAIENALYIGGIGKIQEYRRQLIEEDALIQVQR